MTNSSSRRQNRRKNVPRSRPNGAAPTSSVPQRRPRRARRGLPGSKLGRMHPLTLLHPRLFPRHLTTPNLASKPYVVVRDKVTFTVARPASSVDSIPFLFGSFFDDGVERDISPVYAVTSYGGGGVDPSLNGNAIVAVNIPANLRAKARIHRLSIRVTNTGSVGASAIPDGKFWIGTLRGAADHKGHATWTSLADWLKNRNEAIEHSAYAAFSKPITAVCVPGDMIEYESFNDVGSVSYLGATTDTSLNQAFLVLGPCSNAQNYDIQVDAEWTVEYLVDPVLQSLHSTHESLPSEVWHEARSFVANHSGVLEDVALGAIAATGYGALAEGAAGTLGFLGSRQAIAGAARMAGRSAPRRAITWT